MAKVEARARCKLYKKYVTFFNVLAFTLTVI